MKQAQQRFSTEEDPLVEVLDAELTAKNGVLALQPVSALFATLATKAKQIGLPWMLQKPGALTKALRGRQRALEDALGVKIVLDSHHRGGTYWVVIARENGTGRDGGGGGQDSAIPPREIAGVVP